MKYLILLLLFGCPSFAMEPSVHTKKVAFLIRPDFRGENALAYRLQSASHNLHWEADIIDIAHPEILEQKTYDFVINLCPGFYKHPKCKNYMAIFDPIHHYFSRKGRLERLYRDYDGYLLAYSPDSADKNFNAPNLLPYMKWYPSVQSHEYKKVDPKYLFHLCCIWGNRFEGEKFRRFFGLLDKEPYMRIYGPELLQPYYPQSYQSTIPFDSGTISTIAADAGVTLVLHSSIHNVYGLPSGRIFEAAAASTVIICDENAFVREHFGNSVLYINTDESAESIYNQVNQHMDWIRLNKEEALEKAKRSHEIYKSHFLLEDQLVRLNEFHEKLSNSIFSKWIKKIQNLIYLARRALHCLIFPIPLTVMPNIDHQYSLINSVDFQRQKNLFCATYTHNNKICFYEIDQNYQPHFIQSLHNPLARLSEPQHAVFSPDGEKVVVANWTNQTLTVYKRKENGLYNEIPIAIISSPSALARCKPHGITFSPCGNYLAIAYGASSKYERAIALFKARGDGFECVSLLKNNALPGTPKGIEFSPDGTSLLVTFCEVNSLVIFNIEGQTINPIPKQIIQSDDISRPEDIKITPNGRYCAISNSDLNTISFYGFDSKSNSIPQNSPFYVLQNPDAQLHFPHGIAFSPDGSCLLATQFGAVNIDKKGDIIWNYRTLSSEAKINLYQIDNK